LDIEIYIFIAISTEIVLIINFNPYFKKLVFLFISTISINKSNYRNYFPITRFLFA
jgi:hypothetical protein